MWVPMDEDREPLIGDLEMKVYCVIVILVLMLGMDVLGAEVTDEVIDEAVDLRDHRYIDSYLDLAIKLSKLKEPRIDRIEELVLKLKSRFSGDEYAKKVIDKIQEIIDKTSYNKGEGLKLKIPADRLVVFSDIKLKKGMVLVLKPSGVCTSGGDKTAFGPGGLCMAGLMLIGINYN